MATAAIPPNQVTNLFDFLMDLHASQFVPVEIAGEDWVEEHFRIQADFDAWMSDYKDFLHVDIGYPR
jgi:hypothetical protein